MASIKPYKTKTGRRWRVQYVAPDTSRRTKQGFKTKDAAQAWADKNAVDTRTGDWIDPNAGKTTVAHLAALWEAGQAHLKPATRTINKSTWRVHVQPQWGHREVGSIRPSEVSTWLSSIEKHTSGKNPRPTGEPASATTVRNCHMVLAQILDLAVADRLIRANPARGVKLPAKGKGVKVYLTAAQLDALVSECGQRGDLIALLGTAGLRFGEAVALRRKDIDFLRRRISITRNAVRDDDGRMVVSTPKSGQVRTVTAPAFVFDMLDRRVAGKAPEALLWPAAGGGLMKHLGHTSFFHHAVKRCRVRDPEFPALTPHGLRHVAAGLMVSAGANVKVVQAQLGHESAAMTLDRYSDLFDADLDGIGLALDSLFVDRGKIVANGKTGSR